MFAVGTNQKNNSPEVFITTIEATKIIPYSREYIGRLAREKKIAAILVEGKWLVALASIKEFYKQARIEDTILAERLRHERLADQSALDQLLVTPVTQSAMSDISMHLVSATVTALTILFFFLAPTLLTVSKQVATLSLADPINPVRSTTILEPIETTIPLDMSKGILLFSKNSFVSPIDPMLLFSDDVEVVEGMNGIQSVRIYDGENFSDLPFVYLPLAREKYQEKVITNSDPVVF